MRDRSETNPEFRSGIAENWEARLYNATPNAIMFARADAKES